MTAENRIIFSKLVFIIFPFCFLLTQKIIMATLLFSTLLLVFYFDKGRISKNYNVIKLYFSRIFDYISFSKTDTISNSNIKCYFSPTQYMLISFIITCLFFTKMVVITAWLILIIANCFAELFELRFNKLLFYGKPISYAIVFFFTTIIISIITYVFIGYQTNFFIIVISSFITTIISFFSQDIKIDKNFSIPIVCSIILTLGAYVLS